MYERSCDRLHYWGIHMKVSKNQLRQIIKEERAKLEEGANYALDRALMDMSYKLEDEINATVSQATGDNQWWENPEVVDAVMMMLDELKQTFGSFASNRG